MTLLVFSVAKRRYCSLFDVKPVTIDGVRLAGERLDTTRVRRGVRRFDILDERRIPLIVLRRSPISVRFDCEPLR